MAKVLTGISGNVISAASAAFAPTNSAEVSAIASAYQVVSSTATQLYAGTAYVTSVNGAPISAARAGNAANASLANSAYYDGTGRLISALPDSAAVSAIASAYAESAASGKQDTLTFAYDDDKISAINGSALAGQGGGGGGLVTAIGSLDGHVTSINSSDIVGRPSAVMTRSADENILQADEWMSMSPNNVEGRWFSYSQGINKVYLVPDHTSNDMSATAYDNSYNVVGAVPLTATSCTISSDTAIITRVEARSDENGLSMYISGFQFIPSGDYIEALPSIDACVLKSASVVQLGTAATAESGEYAIKFAQGLASAGSNGFAFGSYVGAEYGVAFGSQVTGKYTSLAAGNHAYAYDNSLAVGDYVSAEHTSMAQGLYVTASSNSFARGSFVSAINSATVLGTYNQSGNGSASSGAAFVIGDGTASNARHDLMVVTKDGEITMFSGTADSVGTGIMSSIRAISAAATGGGGVDSATVSAIASSYAESAVSSVSGNYYTTANESGFLTAQVQASWSESASSSPSYIQDKPDLVDIVAGPGIHIDNPDGNTLRVSLSNSIDTVLWDGPSVWVSASPIIELSESIANFERIGIYAGGYGNTFQQDFKMIKLSAEDTGNGAPINIQGVAGNGSFARFNVGLVYPSANGSALSFQKFNQFNLGTSVNTAASPSTIQRVVGIHRTASVQ